MVQVLPQLRTRDYGAGLREALSSAGQYYANAKSEQKKQEKQEKHLLDVNSELSKALESHDLENMSDIDKIKFIGKQKHPEVRDTLTSLLKTFHDRKIENTLSPQKLFSDIVRKHLGNSPSPSDVQKAEQIYSAGQGFLEQGLDPIKAFNAATEAFNLKQSSKKELKNLKGKSYFGSNEKEDLKKIEKLRKSGILSDEEISDALALLGYEPDEIESKFGLQVSDDMLDHLLSKQEATKQEAPAKGGGNQRLNQPVQVSDEDVGGQANADFMGVETKAPLKTTSPTAPTQIVAPKKGTERQVADVMKNPKQKWNPQNHNHAARAKAIFEETGGDRAKTNQILAEEFER